MIIRRFRRSSSFFSLFRIQRLISEMPVTGSLAIRLALHGCTNRPFYHVVLIRKHKGRNAPPIEQLGTYDPLPNAYGENVVALNFSRIRYWMGCGAAVSSPMLQLLGMAGYLPIHPQSVEKAAKRRQVLAAAEAKISEDNIAENDKS